MPTGLGQISTGISSRLSPFRTISLACALVKILGIYLRMIEEEVRAPLACLIAEEQGPSVRAGDAGRVHFHLLIRCAKPLDSAHLTDIWRKDCFGGDRTGGPSAVVRAYEKEISATFYMMKGLRNPEWGWSEWRLEGASRRKPKRFATSAGGS